MRKAFAKYFIATGLLLSAVQFSARAQDAKTAASETGGTETFLLITIGVLSFALLALATVLFRMKKIVNENLKNAGREKRSAILTTAVLALIFSIPAYAQDAGSASPKIMSNETFLLIIIGILLFALLLMAMVLQRMSNLVRAIKKESSYVKKQSGFSAWWSRLDKKFFTKAIPVEKEEDVLLDHDYDGIKELDNALPPWWKWGFYLTLIIGVFYLLRFHVWKTGPTPEEEYNREMLVAAAKIEKSKSGAGDELNENNVTLADAAGIAEGKKMFLGVCNACHGNNGEGNAIGPNLTDQYWLHGGSINDVFRTITNGVPEKGMQSWKKNYTPAEIRNLSSYILSLQGSNPPNAKAPQGELYTGASPAGSAAVKKDTAAVK